MKIMKKGLVVVIGVFCVTMWIGTQPAFSEMSNRELEHEVKALKDKLDERSGAEESGALEKLLQLTDRLSFSGLIEVESFVRNSFDGEDESDITLATVELGLDAQIADWVTGHILLLWEEDDTEPIDVDEGTITLGNPDIFPVYLTAGKMYVPFGVFETNMIQDPLTLELGETRESALLMGFDISGFYASAYIFNGDIDEYGDDNEIKCYGASAGYAFENDNMGLDIGVDWINNLVDTDGLGDFVEEEGLALKDYMGGLAAHAILNAGLFTLIGEYVGGTDDPEFNLGLFEVELEAMSAWNIEFGYTFEMVGKEATLAVAYQGTDECGGFLPEERYLAAIGIGIGEYVGLALEYAHDDDYDKVDGGTGDDADMITVQLAVEL